jgi:hypothetical protein
VGGGPRVSGLPTWLITRRASTLRFPPQRGSVTSRNAIRQATHGHALLRKAATAQFTTRLEMTLPALLTRYSTLWPPSLTTYT